VLRTVASDITEPGRTRKASVALVALALFIGLTACAGGPSAGDSADRLSAALMSAGAGIDRAEVVRTPSFAGGLTISVTVSSEGLDPIGAEVKTNTLTSILEVAADNSADMKVTSLYLYADDEAGADVSFRDAATELGLQNSLNEDSLTLVAEDLTSFLRK